MKSLKGRYIFAVLAFFCSACSMSGPQAVKHKDNLRSVPRHEVTVKYDTEKISDVVASMDVDKVKNYTAFASEEPETDSPAAIQDDYKPAVSTPRSENAVVNYSDEENESAETREQAMLDTALDYCEAAQELWTAGNPERAIETLDEAYQLVLRVDTEKHPEILQQKEDMRFTISKRILEIYSSRFSTVNGNHKEIPLTMNEHVEREIRSFQGHEREHFMEGYKRSGKYRDAIVTALREAGMPEELVWLPFIESWFKVNALSPARALGIWQFIPSTGYKFGLKRDTWIDERMNPEKSTVAAIAYLKELHKMFGDWTTVLAAYNCGEGNVLRVIRSQKINYLDNFWDLYEKLPRETARYVPRFLATLHIMKDPEKYGFSFGEADTPSPYETVSIEKQVSLKSLAENLSIPAAELIALNPELRRQATPPTHYSLKVPPSTSGLLLAKIETVPSWTIPQNELGSDFVNYTVKKGDTLSRIAAKYQSDVNAIVKVNRLNSRKNIRIGQKLKIPVREGRGIDMIAMKDSLLQDGKYRIKRGETLRGIARKFNTDTTSLKKLNRLTSSLLYEGQLLKIRE